MAIDGSVLVQSNCLSCAQYVHTRFPFVLTFRKIFALNLFLLTVSAALLPVALPLQHYDLIEKRGVFIGLSALAAGIYSPIEKNTDIHG